MLLKISSLDNPIESAQRSFKNAEEFAKSIQILADAGQLMPVKQMNYTVP